MLLSSSGLSGAHVVVGKALYTHASQNPNLFDAIDIFVIWLTSPGSQHVETLPCILAALDSLVSLEQSRCSYHWATRCLLCTAVPVRLVPPIVLAHAIYGVRHSLFSIIGCMPLFCPDYIESRLGSCHKCDIESSIGQDVKYVTYTSYTFYCSAYTWWRLIRRMIYIIPDVPTTRVGDDRFLSSLSVERQNSSWRTCFGLCARNLKSPSLRQLPDSIP